MSNHETELHDEMEIAEAQEMENPEEEESSVDSAEKAADATKKAKARKGDKAQGEKTADKADSGIVEAMKKKMKMAEEEDEDDDDDDDEDEMVESTGLNESAIVPLGQNVKMRVDPDGITLIDKDPLGNRQLVVFDEKQTKSLISLIKGRKTVKKFSLGGTITATRDRDGSMTIVDRSTPNGQEMVVLEPKAANSIPSIIEKRTSMSEMKKGKKMMKKESYDFSEDLDAIIADEATLSEEFKSKTAVIFEAAIKSKLREEVDRLEEQYEQRLTEELEQMSTDLIEKVDGYLDYVVDEWMKENEVAIQNGIRNEIAEGFMSGLKDLFEENYVDVPDSKIDLVDELAEQNEQLNEKANASIEEVLSLREELNNYKRDAIIREATVGLADTQADKLAKLVEDVDFVDEETFIDKVITIRDSYFSKKTSNYQLDEEADQSELTEQASSPVMQSYLTALRKSAKQ